MGVALINLLAAEVAGAGDGLAGVTVPFKTDGRGEGSSGFSLFLTSAISAAPGVSASVSGSPGSRPDETVVFSGTEFLDVFSEVEFPAVAIIFEDSALLPTVIDVFVGVENNTGAPPLLGCVVSIG